MRARCGGCENIVEISGPGRFECPTCGQLNEVHAATDPPESLRSDDLNPVPPAPEPTSQRLTCPSCSFSFIVGAVDTAICPNCRGEVSTGGPGTEKTVG